MDAPLSNGENDMNFPLSRLNPTDINAYWTDWTTGEVSIEASGVVTGTVTDLQIKKVPPPVWTGGGVGPVLLPTFEVLGRVNPLPAIVAPFKVQASFQIEKIDTIEMLTTDGSRSVTVKGVPSASGT